MLTQKEQIIEFFNDNALCPSSQIVINDFCFLQRQEAIKECKRIKKKWLDCLELEFKDKIIYDFLKQHYSITDEELK